MQHSPLLCNAHEGVTQLRNPLKATGQLKARHAPKHQASHCTRHHAQLTGHLRTNLRFKMLTAGKMLHLTSWEGNSTTLIPAEGEVWELQDYRTWHASPLARRHHPARVLIHVLSGQRRGSPPYRRFQSLCCPARAVSSVPCL